MKLICSLVALLTIAQLSVAQDVLAPINTRSTLPGIINIREGQSITGSLAYYGAKVYLYPEGQRAVSYEAEHIQGFTLQNGGGEFISVVAGKKGKSKFYEIVAKSTKLYLITPASTIDERNKPKDPNPLKDNTKYSLYSPEDRTIISSSFDELSAYMLTRCDGISKAIEAKSKNYHYGLMADDAKIRSVFQRIMDDYSAGRCTYVPRDY